MAARPVFLALLLAALLLFRLTCLAVSTRQAAEADPLEEHDADRPGGTPGEPQHRPANGVPNSVEFGTTEGTWSSLIHMFTTVDPDIGDPTAAFLVPHGTAPVPPPRTWSGV
eukprot:8078943-Pyramimonas_sp.AAC.1